MASTSSANSWPRSASSSRPSRPRSKVMGRPLGLGKVLRHSALVQAESCGPFGPSRPARPALFCPPTKPPSAGRARAATARAGSCWGFAARKTDRCWTTSTPAAVCRRSQRARRHCRPATQSGADPAWRPARAWAAPAAPRRPPTPVAPKQQARRWPDWRHPWPAASGGATKWGWSSVSGRWMLCRCVIAWRCPGQKNGRSKKVLVDWQAGAAGKPVGATNWPSTGGE